jgi:betaine-aldehyde dehydrogenase
MTEQQTMPVVDVAKTVGGRDWQMLIGGDLRAAAAGTTAPVRDPSTGEVIVEVPWGGAADVDAACRAAHDAFGPWSKLTVQERAAHLKRFAGLLAENADDLALLDAIDSGNPITAMRREVDAAVAHIENWCGLVLGLNSAVIPASREGLHYTSYRPYGVVARIVPFNHPQLFATTRGIAALLAGNTVVLKPAEQTPLSTLAIARLAREAFPAGVLSFITGGPEAGDALVRHPTVRRVGFIGSTAIGRLIQQRAAEQAVKHVTLELGGKNALIVFPDAEFDAAVEGALLGMNFGVSQGQSCGSTSRVLVHRDLYEDFVEALAARISEIRVGRAYDRDTEMGPLISDVHRTRVEGYIDAGRNERARLVVGGGRPQGLGDGYFVEPTLFADVGRDMRIFREEIFGPVLSVAAWDDYDEVIADANSVEYGLTASVWTQDLTLAHKTADRLEAGYVWVNETSIHHWGTPFGGTKESGVGREESIEELLSYLEEKVTHIKFREPEAALASIIQRHKDSPR